MPSKHKNQTSTKITNNKTAAEEAKGVAESKQQKEDPETILPSGPVTTAAKTTTREEVDCSPLKALEEEQVTAVDKAVLPVTSSSVEADAGNEEEEEGPLTESKLFALSLDGDGNWTEIGRGMTSIAFDPPTSSTLEEEAEESTTRRTKTNEKAKKNKEAKADPARESQANAVAYLVMESLEVNKELLLRTPLSLDDIYAQQNPTLLVWSDAEIGRDMAISFNREEGCSIILSEISAYQVNCRRGNKGNTMKQQKGEERDGDIPNCLEHDCLNGASGGHLSPWTVVRENLPALVLAVNDNRHRFFQFVREKETFFNEVIALWKKCQERSDQVGLEHMGQVTLALLGPPFNSDNMILAQLVNEECINPTIDIVQHALGRTSKSLGFVSTEDRLLCFKNPALLPADVVVRVHYLFALQYLRDLVPLLLEEGDAMGSNMFSTYILRYKMGLCYDVLQTPDLFAPWVKPFQKLMRGNKKQKEEKKNKKNSEASTIEEKKGEDSATLEEGAEVSPPSPLQILPLIHELSTIIRGSVAPVEPKEQLFSLAIQHGLFYFLSAALHESKTSAEWVNVLKCHDILNHAVLFSPNASRLALIEEAVLMASMSSSALYIHPPSDQVSKISTSVMNGETQSCSLEEGKENGQEKEKKSSKVKKAEDGTRPTQEEEEEGKEQTKSKDNLDLQHPPLLVLMLQSVAEVQDDITLEAIHDAVACVGAGISQQNLMQEMFNMELSSSKAYIMKYWTEGIVDCLPLEKIPMALRATGSAEGQSSSPTRALRNEPPLAILCHAMVPCSSSVLSPSSFSPQERAAVSGRGRLSSSLHSERNSYQSLRLLTLFMDGSDIPMDGLHRLLLHFDVVGKLNYLLSSSSLIGAGHTSTITKNSMGLSSVDKTIIEPQAQVEVEGEQTSAARTSSLTGAKTNLTSSSTASSSIEQQQQGKQSEEGRTNSCEEDEAVRAAAHAAMITPARQLLLHQGTAPITSTQGVSPCSAPLSLRQKFSPKIITQAISLLSKIIAKGNDALHQEIIDKELLSSCILIYQSVKKRHNLMTSTMGHLFSTIVSSVESCVGPVDEGEEEEEEEAEKKKKELRGEVEGNTSTSGSSKRNSKKTSRRGNKSQSGKSSGPSVIQRLLLSSASSAAGSLFSASLHKRCDQTALDDMERACLISQYCWDHYQQELLALIPVSQGVKWRKLQGEKLKLIEKIQQRIRQKEEAKEKETEEMDDDDNDSGIAKFSLTSSEATKQGKHKNTKRRRGVLLAEEPDEDEDEDAFLRSLLGSGGTTLEDDYAALLAEFDKCDEELEKSSVSSSTSVSSTEDKNENEDDQSTTSSLGSRTSSFHLGQKKKRGEEEGETDAEMGPVFKKLRTE